MIRKGASSPVQEYKSLVTGISDIERSGLSGIELDHSLSDPIAKRTNQKLISPRQIRQRHKQKENDDSIYQNKDSSLIHQDEYSYNLSPNSNADDVSLSALDLFENLNEEEEELKKKEQTIIYKNKLSKKKRNDSLPTLEKKFLEQVNTCDMNQFYHTMKTNAKKQHYLINDKNEIEQQNLLNKTELLSSSPKVIHKSLSLRKTKSDYQLNSKEFLSDLNQLKKSQDLEYWSSIEQEGQNHNSKNQNHHQRRRKQSNQILPSISLNQKSQKSQNTYNNTSLFANNLDRPNSAPSDHQPIRVGRDLITGISSSNKPHKHVGPTASDLMELIRGGGGGGNNNNTELKLLERKHKEWLFNNKFDLSNKTSFKTNHDMAQKQQNYESQPNYGSQQNKDSNKDLIESMASELPIEFLTSQQSNSLGQEVALTKGMEQMLKILRKVIKYKLKEAWFYWSLFMKECHEKDMETAALVLQGNWRSHASREWVKHLKKQSSDKKQKQKQQILLVHNRRKKAISLIIRTFRIRKFRLLSLLVLLRIKSAKILQHCWRNKLLRLMNWSNFAQQIKEGEACEKIQRLFRGHFGRKKFKRKRMISTQLMAEKRFDLISTTRMANYEMHGSAKKLQVWWRKLPWRVKRQHWQLTLFYILRLQATARIYIARKKYLRLKFKKFGFYKITDVSACQIQRLIRGVMTRHQLGIMTEKGIEWKNKIELKNNLNKKFQRNPQYAKKFVKLVHIVQRIWRGFSARKRYEMMKLKRQGDKVAIIQRTTTRFLAKKKQKRARIVITQWVCHKMKIKKFYFKKITIIQNNWRVRLATKYYERLKLASKKLSMFFIPLAREYVSRLLLKRKQKLEIWKAEDKIAGMLLYKITRDDEIKRQIYAISIINDHNIPFETQAIFSYYCSYGQKGNTSRLGVNNFSKLLKECPSLLENKSKSKFNQQTCELIFTKCLTKNSEGVKESHLLYNEFIIALKHVAEIKLKNVKKYGKYINEDARFIKLLQEYIFKASSCLKIYKTIKPLHVQGRTDTHLNNMTCKIQKCYRGLSTRKKFIRKKSIYIKRQKKKHLIYSTLLVQRVWQGFIGRKKATEQAKIIWEKYLDSETSRPYWYNKATGSTSWTKPLVFGNTDIGNPVKLPKSGNLYTVSCSSCAIRLVSSLCIQCNESHCSDCSKLLHNKKGKRGNHDIIKTEQCIQCEFQVGCKYCFTCKDNYCDTCFTDQHAKGMLQRHDFKPLLPVCEECNQRVARQIILDQDDDKTNHDDNPDNNNHDNNLLENGNHSPTTSSIHGVTNGDDNGTIVSLGTIGTVGKDGVMIGGNDRIKGKKVCDTCAINLKDGNKYIKLIKLPYWPYKVDEYLAQKALELEKRLLEEEFLKKKREALEKKALIEVVRIQKVWRSYHCRKINYLFIIERKKWFKQRKLDDKIRALLSYKVKLIFGFAPKLISDTMVETILKKYPTWSYNFIIDIVNSDWQECYNMVIEQEKYIKNRKFKYYVPPNFTNLYKIKQYDIKKYFYSNKLNKKKLEYEKSQLLYRNARSATGTNETIKSELQTQMRLKKRDYDISLSKYEEICNEQLKFHKIKSLRWGPKEFEKRINKIRKQGWPLKNVKVNTKYATPYATIHPSTITLLNQPLNKILPSSTSDHSEKRRNKKYGKKHKKSRNKKDNTPLSSKRLIKNNKIELGNYIRIENSAAIYRIIWNSANPSLMHSCYLYMVRRWVLFTSKLEGLDYSKEEDRAVIEGRIPKWIFDNENLNKIRLDRDWTYEDINTELQFYKLPRLSPPYQFYYFLTRSMKSFFITQAILKQIASYYEFISMKFKATSQLFDEESKFHIRFDNYSIKYNKYKINTIHKYNKLPNNINDPDSFYDNIKSIYRTFRRIILKSRNNLQEKRAIMNERAKRDKDPLTFWTASKRQLEVLVKYSIDNVEEDLGYLKVDLDIPVTLSRGLLHRYLWKELNNHHGGSFLFKIDDDDTLAIEKEQISKLDTLIKQKLNVKTRQAEYILVLQQDPDGDDNDKIDIYDWELEEANIERIKSVKEKELEKELLENAENGNGDGGENDDENDEDRFKNVNEQIKRQKFDLKVYYSELAIEAEEKAAEKAAKQAALEKAAK